MLEETILSEQIIQNILESEYGIKINEVERLNRGSANIYKIIGDRVYILKEFTSDRTKESIEKEYSIINHLALKGLKVPEYIMTKDNKCLYVYNGRIIIVQVFLDGYTMENNTGDYNKVIESANILGRLVNGLSDYTKEVGTYNDWPTKEGLLKGIDKLKELKSKINDDNPYHDKFINDIQYKIEVSNKLIDLDFDEMKKVTQMICHGDYSVQQLIYKDNEETSVIDFETVKKMPVVWEVIRSYSYVDKNCVNGEFNLNYFKDYVKEVMKYVKLTNIDLKYMPYIYLCQLVGSTFGYKQYNNDYSKKGLLEFALFRTNTCRYLYNNMDKINNILKEIER